MAVKKTKSRELSWPDNNRFAAGLSHDVDLIFKNNLIGSLKQIKNKPWDTFRVIGNAARGENPYWQFEQLMELEMSYGVRSTFFFCAKRRHIKDPYYSVHHHKISQMIRRLDAHGFEIGMHGSYLSYNRQDFITEEKKILENVLGKKISGNRQHFLNWDTSTAEILDHAGFVYDSTFGSRDAVGFKNNKLRPFRINQTGLLEVPMNVMDGALFGICRDKTAAWKKVKSILDIAKNKKAVVTFNWHQGFFYEPEFPGWSDVYIKILDYLKKSDAFVAPLAQIAKLFDRPGDENGRD